MPERDIQSINPKTREMKAEIYSNGYVAPGSPIKGSVAVVNIKWEPADSYVIVIGGKAFPAQPRRTRKNYAFGGRFLWSSSEEFRELYKNPIPLFDYDLTQER